MKNKLSTDPQHITIAGQTYRVGFSFRSIRNFEELTGKSITECTSTWDNLVFFYCTIKALNPEFTANLDTFVDYIDTDPNLLVEFQNLQATATDNPESSPDASGENPASKKKANLFGLWTLSALLLVSPVLVPLISGISLLYLSLKLLARLIGRVGKKLASPFSRLAAPSPSPGTTIKNPAPKDRGSINSIQYRNTQAPNASASPNNSKKH